MLSAASGVGNIAILLGAATGRDGIGGASILASASFDEESGAKRPSVQVGDPFEEKKLIEACLELYQAGLVVGIQDLGAAGISCATSECAANGGMGMDVDLDSVPVREHGMTAGEILMSESQERMLAIVEPESVPDVVAVAEKWDINASVIGTVTQGGTLRVRQHGELVAELPAASLSDDAPKYDRPAARPEYLDELWAQGSAEAAPGDFADVLLALLDDPAIADRSWIYQQYDHQLFLNTVVEPGHDGSLLRIKGTEKALAVSTDGNGRRCFLDPRRGAARLVMESALNVAVTGTNPYAVVDNLNFGNPEKPEIMWQFIETVEGMSEACELLNIPVIGGNVSFYNETDGVDIFPSPVVGMLGFADPMPANPPRLDRAEDGMEIWLIGAEMEPDLAASAFARVIHGRLDGRPADIDSAVGPPTIVAATQLAQSLPVLHDISIGGLGITLAEIAIQSDCGFTIDELDWSQLWSEAPHRFVAVCEPGAMPELAVPAKHIGTMGGTRLEFKGHGSASLNEATQTWREALPRRMA